MLPEITIENRDLASTIYVSETERVGVARFLSFLDNFKKRDYDQMKDVIARVNKVKLILETCQSTKLISRATLEQLQAATAVRPEPVFFILNDNFRRVKKNILQRVLNATYVENDRILLVLEDINMPIAFDGKAVAIFEFSDNNDELDIQIETPEPDLWSKFSDAFKSLLSKNLMKILCYEDSHARVRFGLDFWGAVAECQTQHSN